MSESALVLDLRAIDDSTAPRTGPKAASLARLMRAALPVPQGFCVTAAAYRAHAPTVIGMESNPAALEALRRAILDRPMDRSLENLLNTRAARLGATALAVRSSATAEDLASASFAGQYDSFLDVAPGDCALHMRRCWASLWSERAAAYRARVGVESTGLAMAVVVQVMVRARVSGVLFTNDGDEGMVLEMAQGTGEALVSGRVAPHRVTLERASLGSARAGAALLDDATTRRLAALAMDAERAFGVPLDIEWSVDFQGRVWLLQARPITARLAAGATRPATASAPTASATTEAPRRQVWTNANAGEVLPGVVTPLTRSLIEPLVRVMLDTIAWHMGATLGDLPLMGFFAGRVYFNLNTITAFLRGSPATRGRSIEELLGGLHGTGPDGAPLRIPESDLPRINVNQWRMTLRVPLLAARLLAHRPAGAERHILAMRRATLASLHSDKGGCSERDLIERADDEMRALQESFDTFLYVAVGMLYSMGLYQGCPRWFGADGDAMLGRLLAGSGAVEHADVGPGLWRLARRARATPALESRLRSAGSFAAFADDAAVIEGGREFLRAWNAFMIRHGHHARGEIELGTPRWAEEPDAVLHMVRSQLEGLHRIDPGARAADLDEDRVRALGECRRRLRHPLKRLAFECALPLARRGIPVRENIKNELVRRLYALRLLLLEFGRRLEARGVLQRPDDVFFLSREELLGAMGGAIKLRDLVASRRARHELDRVLTPPSVIVGDFDPAQPGMLPDSTRMFRGVGVCPGVVEGPARVIRHAQDGQIHPGEILVAPFTDPGWTPYFLNAAAIVVDMGGILSHGSIVARELGVPCVVNVGPASVILRDGQRLRVDGAAGTVELLG